MIKNHPSKEINVINRIRYDILKMWLDFQSILCLFPWASGAMPL
jgi:hypothetical protein